MTTNKTQTFLPNNLLGILGRISKIIDLGYFREYIGQTTSIHLLVYVAGLILCRRNVAMTTISQVLRLCTHDGLQRMLLG